MTTNGLWIRDTIDNNVKYINADKIVGTNLLNVSISEFDENFNLNRGILCIFYNREKVYIIL